MVQDIRAYVFSTRHALVDASDPVRRLIGFATQDVDPVVSWHIPITRMKSPDGTEAHALSASLAMVENRQGFIDALERAARG